MADSPADDMPNPTNLDDGPGGPAPEAPRVLLVEDESDFREVVSLRLKQQGYEVVEAESAGSGWELAHARPVQAAILDYRLPGITGQSLAYLLRQEFGSQLLLLAFTSWPIGDLAKNKLFDSVHAKPDLGSLLTSLRALRGSPSDDGEEVSCDVGAPAAKGRAPRPS